MSDPVVARWKQQGRVYLWRYRDNTRNYPGWSFTADVGGCASLIALLELMRDAEYPSRQMIRASGPTPEILMVPNNQQGTARWQSATTLELHYPKGRIEPDTWELEATETKVRLVVGALMLDRLTEAVRDIQAGQGDYALGSEDGPDESLLFVWWHPRAA